MAFATDEERRAWLDRMFELAQECGVRVWGYCLMPDHVHLVAAPETEDGLGRVMRRLQADYARAANFFRRERGPLWEGRCASCAMTEADALIAVAHIELNPVRAGLARHAVQHRWSSARAHLVGTDPERRLEMEAWARHFTPEAWLEALREGAPEPWVERFRMATRRGWPLGLEALAAECRAEGATAERQSGFESSRAGYLSIFMGPKAGAAMPASSRRLT
jgi:putative transposase